MQVDIFYKSGQQVDWVKFNIKAGQIYFAIFSRISVSAWMLRIR